MQRNTYRSLILTLICFLGAGFGLQAHAQLPHVQKPIVLAPSLKGSLLKNEERQPIYVAMPSDYYAENKRYPVLYFLHGYGAKPEQAAIFAKFAKDFIVVGVNGYNQYAGSFYADSPVTGGWESFVVKDVINYVDKNFKTIPSAEGRGLAGFSMGGAAAINIGLKHPDKFQHVFALSPTVFGRNGLDKAMKQLTDGGWSRLLNGYGAAFAPNPHNKEKPWITWNPENQGVRTFYESGWGNWKVKIGNYVKGDTFLKTMRVEYGKKDRFPWIPEGAYHVASMLKTRGANIQIVDHNGGHDLKDLQAQHLVNFFNDGFGLGKDKTVNTK